MPLRHLLFPQRIKFPDTKYNRNVVLNRYFLQPTLMSDGLIESGDILSHIWKTGIKNLVPRNFIPKNILLLGLGGGSNALLVAKLYPHSQITAVEIDPQMIDISLKYFGTKKLKNLKIINGDALPFANHLTSKDHFDLILVDCFEGKYIPKKLENLDFIQALYDHSRFILINRIDWFEHRQPTLEFFKKLSTRFFFITAHTRSNSLISLL